MITQIRATLEGPVSANSHSVRVLRFFFLLAEYLFFLYYFYEVLVAAYMSSPVASS